MRYLVLRSLAVLTCFGVFSLTQTSATPKPPQDKSAVRIVAQMDELFAIDAQARQERLSQEDRQLLRLEKFKPLARS
jgi:hypothetical protein